MGCFIIKGSARHRGKKRWEKRKKLAGAQASEFNTIRMIRGLILIKVSSQKEGRES